MPAKKPEKPTFAFPTVNGAQLRDLFNISQQALNELANRNVIRRVARDTYDFRESIRSYTEHLRAMAAKQRGANGIDATTESAMLNRERRKALAQEAMVNAGRLIPVEVVESVMADHITGLRQMVLGFANEAQIDLPHLPAEDINTLKTISERILKNNVVRIIDQTKMHPEIQDYIDKKTGKAG